jgi:hypothetical protein
MTSPVGVARETLLRRLEPSDRPALASLIESVELFSAEEKVVALEVVDSYMEHPGQDYHALGAFTHRDVLLGYACYGARRARPAPGICTGSPYPEATGAAEWEPC